MTLHRYYDNPEEDPSADALLRYRYGYSPKEERSAIEKRLSSSAETTADLKSIDYIKSDLRVCHADREMLSSGFPPNREHARLCRDLTEKRLLEIRKAGCPSEDTGTTRHLSECPYCRQRLLMLSKADPGKDHQPLGYRIVAAMMEPVLEKAAGAVDAVVPWAKQSAAAAGNPMQRLVREIRVWIDETGRTITEGLEGLLWKPADKMLCTLNSELPTAAEPGEGKWLFPLEELNCTLKLSLLPETKSGLWQLACELDDSVGPTLGLQAQIVICDSRGAESSYSVASLKEEPAFLKEGDWLLKVKLQNHEWQIPLSLGREQKNDDE